MSRGGKRPGAGRRPGEGRGYGPRTSIRWSEEEYAEVANAAGGADAIAMWAREILLAHARGES